MEKSDKKEELLLNFGRNLIERARDKAFFNACKVLKGESNVLENKMIYENLKDLDPKKVFFLKKLLVDTIDCSLHYLMSIFEENDKFDLVAYDEDGNNFSLKELSGDLYGQYWSFVHDMSSLKSQEDL